jgi:hypothetical protein
MKKIAEKTSGIYSYVDDQNSLKEAFDLFVTGLTSVAATCVKITLEAHEGIIISSVESGGHGSEVSSDKRSGEININDIYAGERKNFIVYLTVAEGKKKLLTVGGKYQGFNTCKQLGDMDVFVLRPRSACPPGKLAIHPEVASELVRTRLEKALSAVSKLKYISGTELEWQELWNKIRFSDEGRFAPAETLLGLGRDVAQIRRDAQYYGRNHRAYLISWLSCHKWQRASTKGSSSNSGAFSLAPYGVSGQHVGHEES